MNPIETATCSRIATILEKEMLAVHFQPIICLKSQAIYGYEGLIRGPVNTILQPPAMLFDAATQCGRRAQLDLLCRKMVIRQFTRLNLPGRLFINVDPVSILHENFHAGNTLELVERMGLESSNVIIELTETHPIDDIHLLKTCMAHYRSMGFRVALDDLGAGYSGLKLWSEIKPNIVKVDRHFIQGIDEDRTKQQFVRHIVKTATYMGCQVITEGVETEREYALLRKLGTEMVQGYYFSRPKAVPLQKIPPSLFRKEERKEKENTPPTVEKLLRPAISVGSTTTVSAVGELFTDMVEVESIVVLHDNEVLGMVLRKEFMNIYASLYGKELYGKEPILKFMNRNILKVEKNLSLEDVSHRLTSSLDLYTEEFVLLDNCHLAGKARLIDLLHEITTLQVNKARYANPLTLLPGNVPIQEQLLTLFQKRQFFIVCYFDLDNFKPFNDLFGFRKGDEVILLVAELLTTYIPKQHNFIGHIGGDDFVVIFREREWEQCVQKILTEFDHLVHELYDNRKGDEELLVTDRQGNLTPPRRMGLSVGAVMIEEPMADHTIDLSREAAIAKHKAKSHPGSTLYIHRPAEQKSCKAQKSLFFEPSLLIS